MNIFFNKYYSNYITDESIAKRIRELKTRFRNNRRNILNLRTRTYDIEIPNLTTDINRVYEYIVQNIGRNNFNFDLLIEMIDNYREFIRNVIINGTLENFQFFENRNEELKIIILNFIEENKSNTSYIENEVDTQLQRIYRKYLYFRNIIIQQIFRMFRYIENNFLVTNVSIQENLLDYEELLYEYLTTEDQELLTGRFIEIESNIIDLFKIDLARNTNYHIKQIVDKEMVNNNQLIYTKFEELLRILSNENIEEFIEFLHNISNSDENEYLRKLITNIRDILYSHIGDLDRDNPNYIVEIIKLQLDKVLRIMRMSLVRQVLQE